MNGRGQAPGSDDADPSAPGRKPTSPTPDTDPAPTSQPQVPDYELIRRIGHGAYGDVWLARSKATNALRAAKIVWRHTFEDAKPFQREFAGIQHFERVSREHPSQLALFHIGQNEAGGYFYYVMELADQAQFGPIAEGSTFTNDIARPDVNSYTAHTLRADLEKGRLPTAKVLEIGLALSEALAHLHSNGLVHRDVKPSNVIFVNGRPKLADIGLVTDASDQCSIVGTEGYLPPEGPGTPQADIFALGKMLYEAATGMDRREFPKLPEDLRSWPDAAQMFEVNEIILKACAQDSRQRYQSCDEMRADLALLGQGKSVKQKRTRQQWWAMCKRAGIMLTAIATITACALTLSRVITPSEVSDTYHDGQHSTNMLADQLCKQGLDIIRDDLYLQFPQAYSNFNQAIERDPHFARPYVGLLELLLRESNPGVRAKPDELRNVAAKLNELDPNLAATAVAKSIISYFDWNFPAAKQFAMQAILTDPKYELGHTWFGFMLTDWGWPVEGREQLEIARTNSPFKVTIFRCLGHTYFMERNFTNAIIWYRKALELEPHHAIAADCIGRAFEAMGDYTNALENYEQADQMRGYDAAATKQKYDELRSAFKAGGTNGLWQERWKRVEASTNLFYWKAVIQLHLTNTDAAFYWLKRSCDVHERRQPLDSPLNYLLWDECWDGLHDDPQFTNILNKIGFTKVMPHPKQRATSR